MTRTDRKTGDVLALEYLQTVLKSAQTVAQNKDLGPGDRKYFADRAEEVAKEIQEKEKIVIVN